jgi:hypothetical protein
MTSKLLIFLVQQKLNLICEFYPQENSLKLQLFHPLNNSPEKEKKLSGKNILA